MGLAGLATAYRHGALRERPEDSEACRLAQARFEAAGQAWEADPSRENGAALRAAEHAHYRACQTAMGNACRDAQARRAAAAAPAQAPPSDPRE